MAKDTFTAFQVQVATKGSSWLLGFYVLDPSEDSETLASDAWRSLMGLFWARYRPLVKSATARESVLQHKQDCGFKCEFSEKKNHSLGEHLK